MSKKDKEQNKESKNLKSNHFYSEISKLKFRV